MFNNKDNLLRKAREDDQILIGFATYLGHPAIVEIAGLAGFDYVFIDMEHTPLDWSRLESLVRAADLMNMASIVRVETNSEAEIRKVLELGADAVKVPHISSAEAAALAVRHAKFPPHGVRGTAGFVRSANYAADWDTWLTRANRDTYVDVLIEDAEAIDRLDEIFAVPGIGIASFGPNDYAVSLGVPGKIRDPRVKQALAAVTQKARAHGLVVMAPIFSASPVEGTKELVEMGVRLPLLGGDIALFNTQLRRMAEDVISELR